MRRIATSGCFDILHAGHAHYLRTCRSYGDSLTVLLNDDESVMKLKGRCINPVEDRKAVLQAIRWVDEIIVFSEDTPCRALQELKPNVFCKDEAYKDGVLIGGHQMPIPEQSVMDSLGGSIIFIKPKKDVHTTSIIQRVWNLPREGTFTDEEVRNGVCSLCGKPAFDQWHVTSCALGKQTQHILVCVDCDIAHNRQILELLQAPNIDELMAAYEKTVRETGSLEGIPGRVLPKHPDLVSMLKHCQVALSGRHDFTEGDMATCCKIQAVLDGEPFKNAEGEVYF